MTISTLTSTQNPTYKQLVRLLEKRERDRSKKFLIEGYREILRAYEGNIRSETLLICPKYFLGENEWGLIQKIQKQEVRVIELSEPLFKKLSFRDRPDGMLLLAHQFNTDLDRLEDHLSSVKNPFILIAEGIEKPGNLGSILRSCDATGVDAVIVCDQCTDIYNPNVIRSSVGTVFTVPIFEGTTPSVLKLLRKFQIAILAATPHTNRYYTDEDFNRPIAIAVGTEQLGLSETWMKEADLKVKIPMLGKADSLNVANATTLFLYEVVRQRGLNRG